MPVPRTPSPATFIHDTKKRTAKLISKRTDGKRLVGEDSFDRAISAIIR